MVKNLPSVERSTQIRFGKNVPEATEQAENTIIFNASNDIVPAEYSNAVYLSPIRNRSNYTAPEIVLLMYDRNTKEITESGESANALIGGSTLDTVANRSNATSNTLQYVGALNNVGFVTDSNVGISNLNPEHTMSVGSNLYIDDTGSNVLVVSGDVAILNNLTIDGSLLVNGPTSLIYTENTTIKDAIVELGTNNSTVDTTVDLGIIMRRPDFFSNVIVGYREDADEFAIAYTEGTPTDKLITPKTDEDINVHVYGLTHIDANIYAHEDVIVAGNVHVSTNVYIVEDLNISNNVYANKDLEVLGNVYVSTNVYIVEDLNISNNVYANKDLEVVGNVYVDGNVVAYKDLSVTGNVYIVEDLNISNNVYANKDVEVVGNVYVSGNVVAYKDFTLTGNAYINGNVYIVEDLNISNNVYANKDLEVVGNVYVDGNVVAYKDFTLTGNAYVTGNVSIIEELTISNNVYADKDLEVMGNVYVDGNVVAYKNLSVTGNAYVTGNVEVTNRLIVSGNTHLQGDNVFITNTLDLLDPKTALTTDHISNVHVKLDQLSNVVLSNYLNEDIIVYNGTNWTNQKQNHTFIYAKANGVTLNKGDVVYATGTTGNNIFNIAKADARDPTKMPAIGVVYQNLAAGQEGLVVSFGRADSVNTFGFKEGETVYVSNTVPGGLSNVVPHGVVGGIPNLIQNVGLVVKPHLLQGIISVTGVGRTNAIPNGAFITNYNDMDCIYVNSLNNDLKKIRSENLNIPLTTAVSSSSNSVANAVTLRGMSVTSGDGFHGDLVVTGNVTVDTNTFKVDAETSRVGVGTITPKSTLHVTGNAFVTSNITTSSNVLIVGTAASTSKTTGALQVTGGVGIQGNINATYANIESVTVTNATHSISKDTGALIVTQGGLGVESNIHSTNVFVASHMGVGTSQTSNTFDVRGTSNVGTLITTSTHISDATASISKTSGALLVKGGAGIQGNVYATNGVFTSNVTIDNLSGGTNKYLPMVNTQGTFVRSPVYVTPSGKYVITASEAEFLGNITLGGNTTILSSTSVVIEDRIFGIGKNNSADGFDSGILLEHQDDGVFSNIGLIHHAFDHKFSIGYTQNTFTDNHILYNSHPDDIILTVDLLGNVNVQNSISVSELGTFGTSVVIGANSPDSNLFVTGNVYATSNIITESNVLVTGPTAATSKTTGALQVTGGVGVSGDIYATNVNFETVEADNITVTDTTTSDSTTSGALKVAGGISTQENLNVEGVIKSWNTTDASSTSTGAVQIVGGLGVSNSIHADTIRGATILTGPLIYGTIEGSNTASFSTLYGTLSGSNTASVSTLTVTDTTQATSVTTGAHTVIGGISTQTNVHASNVYTHGGLITNRAGTCMKTYSHKGSLPLNATIANATFGVQFSNHIFQAKIYAILVEGTVTVSRMVQDCCGGHISGGVPGTITLGTTNVIGHSACPWDTIVNANTNTVTIKAKENVVGNGYYDIFVEYLSSHADGRVEKFTQGGVDEIMFNY